ncbi:nuclear body protein [Clarias magur]|uniref:Nuclear body protein n=1 Tax=Clarias magur TaxID=1594786 RepID=A0A8J4X8U1_CLAMG|nr:nuclear body protein [Clarias magur]
MSKAESGSDTDSDWLSEEGPLKLRNRERKRKVIRQGSRRSGNEDRRVSVSPHVLPQKKPTSILQKLGENLIQEPKLSVTCGNKEGVLHKDKFSKGEPCILTGGQWLTPPHFEKFGGKERNKNWKYSVCCSGVQLKQLILEGFLSSPSSFKMKRSRDKEPQSRKEMNGSRRRSTRHGKNCRTISSVSTSASCEADCGTDDKEEEEEEDDDDGDDVRFKVTCSTGKGVLHVERFATETHGKCIRTQDAWLTPKDFLNRNKPGGNWRRDIRNDDGEPLGELLMKRVLKRHRVNCRCYICTEDLPHVLDQNNDDWCFKCKGEGDLVCCRTCPRAFHHHCHKPALRDDDVDSDTWTCSFCKKSRRKKPS